MLLCSAPQRSLATQIRDPLRRRITLLLYVTKTFKAAVKLSTMPLEAVSLSAMQIKATKICHSGIY